MTRCVRWRSPVRRSSVRAFAGAACPVGVCGVVSGGLHAARHSCSPGPCIALVIWDQPCVGCHLGTDHVPRPLPAPPIADTPRAALCALRPAANNDVMLLPAPRSIPMPACMAVRRAASSCRLGAAAAWATRRASSGPAEWSAAHPPRAGTCCEEATTTSRRFGLAKRRLTAVMAGGRAGHMLLCAAHRRTVRHALGCMANGEGCPG